MDYPSENIRRVVVRNPDSLTHLTYRTASRKRRLHYRRGERERERARLRREPTPQFRTARRRRHPTSHAQILSPQTPKEMRRNRSSFIRRLRHQALFDAAEGLPFRVKKILLCCCIAGRHATKTDAQRTRCFALSIPQQCAQHHEFGTMESTAPTCKETAHLCSLHCGTTHLRPHAHRTTVQRAVCVWLLGLCSQQPPAKDNACGVVKPQRIFRCDICHRGYRKGEGA